MTEYTQVLLTEESNNPSSNNNQNKITLPNLLGCKSWYQCITANRVLVNPSSLIFPPISFLIKPSLRHHLIHLLNLNLPKIGSSLKYSKSKIIHGLTHILINTYFPTSEQLHHIFPDYVAHSHSYLGKLIGRCVNGSKSSQHCLTELNNLFPMFEVINCWKKGSYTKGYKLLPWLAQSIDDYIDRVYWSDNSILMSFSDDDFEQCDSKKKAIDREDGNGKRRKTTGNLRLAVKINVVAIRNYILNNKPGKQSIEYKHAMRLIDEALSRDLPTGWIPHPYREISSGRVYSHDISLQNICRDIRNAALEGCYKLDMENAHYSFLNQAAEQAGINLVGIKYYLENKHAVRRRVADDVFGGSPKNKIDDIEEVKAIAKAKTALIALIYGASTVRSSYLKNDNQIKTTLANLAGSPEQFKVLVSHPLFKSIADDVKTGGSVLVNNARKRGDEIFNILGKPISNTARTSQKTAHMLQGIEAKALDAIINIEGGNISLLLHDGVAFYSKVNHLVLEAAILKATGYHVALEEE